ncbi:MAG TPA: RHS repeat-associated core domain-containing protein [Edaphobacter sp.]|uniref:RHS repeat domain-containing protein n=1 Tax=Edaphobacter sp. TaxID=1934404 RepID=UPI002CCBED1F|nr:RHS repeat-associated core domain-containing protein [Edaphobacter sp.]HUZ96501.1 RHS repeat-associated core domain-containing protein [Edaphobacter sp.]
MAGLSAPYNIVWASPVTPHYYIDFTLAPTNDTNCPGLPPIYVGVPIPHIQSITLPNGEQYQFSYDSTYGTLKTITYPNGSSVSYDWAIIPNFEPGYFHFTRTMGSYGINYQYTSYCAYNYDIVGIVGRHVFQGSTEVLTQTFSYTPASSFAGLTTTAVTTTDNVRHNSTTTTTTYYKNTEYANGYVPYAEEYTPGYMSMESTESTTDYSGSVLQTTQKAWYNGSEWYERDLLQSDKVTVGTNGPTSQSAYSYAIGGTVAEKDEYDYGASSPTRKTIIQYHTFGSTPIYPYGSSILDRPSSVITYDSGGSEVAETDYAYDQNAAAGVSATQHDETNYGPSSTAPRGNATSVVQKCLQNCPDAVTQLSYDETGQVISTTDAKGNQTTYSYADNPAGGNPAGNSDAYLTKIIYPFTNGIQHVEKFQYDYGIGYLTEVIDENGQPTDYTYNDPLRRLTEAQGPPDPSDGNQRPTTTYSYNDSGSSPSITTTVLQAPDPAKTTVQVMDGMGHTVQTELTSDTEGTDYVTTAYDGIGRVYTVTNPYRSTSDATYGLTTYTYDVLGRKVLQQNSDGSMEQWCYNGIPDFSGQTNCVAQIGHVNPSFWVDFTDETGRHWQRSSDGLGRLTEVIEDASNSKLETDYQYDALDDLARVDQWGGAYGGSGDRVRTFTYDSLSRLLSAQNPETGTTTYSYVASGSFCSGDPALPCSKTDANNVTINYSYDALDRIIQKQSPSWTWSYTYDLASVGNGGAFQAAYPIGRLVEASNNVNASEQYSYNSRGLVAYQANCIPSNCTQTGNAFYAQYDLANNLTSLTYPDGRVVQNSWDGAGHLTGVNYTSWNGQSVGYNYLSSASYWPDGAPMTMSSGNGLTTTWYRNDRLQPVETILQNGSGAKLFDREYCYGPAAPVSGASCSSQNTADNGNIFQILDVLNGNNSQGFSYDNLNRIVAFANGGGNMQQTYSIDPWGNLSQSGTLSSGLFFTGAATNRDTSGTLGYDNAGNVTGWASDYQGTLNHSYAYDPEGHITGVDNGAATYTYDAEGNRARKDSGGSWTEYVYFNGQPLTENNGGAIWIDYIFANGVRLAQGSSINAPNDSSATIYYHSDQLSSTRLLTDSGGNVVSSYEFYPFGQGPQPSGQNHYLYTGKERDAESGNDYFGARYFGSSMGRFLSPDPFIPFNLKKDQFQAWIANPQHWNKYAYALNNPLKYTDPTGMTETIYYFLNSNLTQAQRDFINKHLGQIENAIADKLHKAGIKDVVFKDGSQLSASEIHHMDLQHPEGVARLNFANQGYGGWNSTSANGGTMGNVSAVLMGNFDGGHPLASDLIQALGNVGAHELGHGMGFAAHTTGWSATDQIYNLFHPDLMNENQGNFGISKPKYFDMSIPQNRQAVEEINKQPEYQPW